MDDPLIKAQLDFEPVPPRRRRTPGRTRNLQGRLYIGKYVEHDEIFSLLKAMPHGEGAKVVVKALLHFRDTVIEPLKKAGDSPAQELVSAARYSFTPKADGDDAIQHLGIRLYIDRWQEHREADEFLSEMQSIYREGNKTLIRALQHYRPVLRRLEQRRARRRSS